jgi:ribosomal protein L29
MINKQFVLDVLKTISTSETSRGKSNKDNKIKNKDIKDDIKLFYNNTFSKLIDVQLSYSNKTHILEQTAKEMITCLETNISTHFMEYLFKYINCVFKKSKSNEIKKEKDKEVRKKLYKELNEEIRNLKSDLINNKIDKSKSEYHEWIKNNKKFLYPEKITKSVAYDLKIHPQKYLTYAFYINSKIEEYGIKNYQVIPQRNNIIPKNIVLNTSAISDYIGGKYPELFNYNKSEIILNCKKYQKHVWSKILKLEKRSIFHNKDYVFYNQITTDGFSCGLLFILKKYKDKEFGDRLPKNKEKEDDKLLTKLEALNKVECDKYLDKDKYKIISLDPGKIRIMSMIDEKDKFYKYSACRRRFENYTKRSNQIIKEEKKKHKIIEKETKLSKFNSKTLKLEEYKKFIKEKNKLNNDVKSFYHNVLFRKLSFRRFVRTKQSEVNLLNEIENKFLEDL